MENVQDKIIIVENLTKQFGDFTAVKGISFEVKEGEIFGLLGPNGAGKSTTLEIIETLREKTSGTVMVNGFDLDKSPESIKKMIGVQLQTAGFYPNLNLTELIHLFVGLYQNEIDADALLQKVNLQDKANAKFKELSGGQKQRFSIATTLINKPKIIFLDEPTTGLHFEDIRVLMEVINQLVDKGNTVIVIEHNLDVIKQADYVIDIGPEGGKKGGQIIAEGTPEEVCLNEQSHTARFLKKELGI